MPNLAKPRQNRATTWQPQAGKLPLHGKSMTKAREKQGKYMATRRAEKWQSHGKSMANHGKIIF